MQNYSLFTINYSLKTAGFAALGRRPGTPQVEMLSGARDGQSDEGAPARPLHHLVAKRGVQAGDRPRAKRGGMPKKLLAIRF